jgi:hypothetical protein
MKKIIRLTESDLTRIVRRVLRESNDDPRMYHRYTDGGNPGIEKFFEEPLNGAIARELEQQLEDDEYANIDNPTNIARGTRTMRIFLNGKKYTIDDFIDHVQEAGEADTCYTIDEYEYKNRFLGSTNITIKADQGPCKKKSNNPERDVETEPEDQTPPSPTQPIKKDKPIKKTKPNGCPLDSSQWYENVVNKGMDPFPPAGFEWGKVVPSMGVSKESICKCFCSHPRARAVGINKMKCKCQ